MVRTLTRVHVAAAPITEVCDDRGSVRSMLVRALMAVVVAVLLGGCGSDAPAGLEGFETSTSTGDGRELADGLVYLTVHWLPGDVTEPRSDW